MSYIPVGTEQNTIFNTVKVQHVAKAHGLNEEEKPSTKKKATHK